MLLLQTGSWNVTKILIKLTQINIAVWKSAVSAVHGCAAYVCCGNVEDAKTKECDAGWMPPAVGKERQQEAHGPAYMYSPIAQVKLNQLRIRHCQPSLLRLARTASNTVGGESHCYTPTPQTHTNTHTHSAV